MAVIVGTSIVVRFGWLYQTVMYLCRVVGATEQ